MHETANVLKSHMLRAWAGQLDVSTVVCLYGRTLRTPFEDVSQQISMQGTQYNHVLQVAAQAFT